MRAIRLRHAAPSNRLQLETASCGTTRPGQIKVNLHAGSLNYHDLMVVNGAIPTLDGRIPLSDGAGEVVEIGEGVTEFTVGDRVVSSFHPRWISGLPTPDVIGDVPGDRTDGYARDTVIVNADYFVHAPADYSYTQSATLPCAGLTAWRALFVESVVKPGQTVLIQGSGGVSTFALLFAKAAGAHVIATSSSDEKLERLQALGADQLINYRKDESWGKTARNLARGRGVDHVVDVAGALAQSASACATGGHIALVAALGGVAEKVPVLQMIGKNLRISGLSVGSRDDLKAMIRAIEVSRIRPVIDSTFSLETIVDAFRHLESRQHFGKICLEW